MSLAEDHDAVARARRAYRVKDGGAPIDEFFIRFPAEHGQRARLHLVKDRRRIFCARIIRRDVDEIRHLRADPSHDGALCPVAVAAAAKDDDDAPPRHGARRPQDVLHPVRRVRIVHDDGEILPRAHELEPPRYARKSLERRAYHIVSDALRTCRPRCREHVVDVEFARDMESERTFLISVHEPHRHAVLREPDVPRRQRRLLRHAIGEHGTGRIRAHDCPRRIVRVDDGGLARLYTGCRNKLKKPRLCARIVFHRFMIVEMILRQVRKDGGIELDARHTPLIERMGGNLHHDRIHAARPHLREHLLHDDHVGRRVRRGEHLVLHHHLDRPNEPHAPPRSAQNRTRETARRRLPVRSRDADNAHRPCRIVVEIRHDHIKRRVQIRHMEHRDARGNIDVFPLRQNSASSRPRRIWYEGMRIHMRAADAYKERARFYSARVTLHRQNLNCRVARDPRARNERSEFTESLHHQSFPFMRKIHFLRNLHVQLLHCDRLDACGGFELCNLDFQPLVLLLELLRLLLRLKERVTVLRPDAAEQCHDHRPECNEKEDSAQTIPQIRIQFTAQKRFARHLNLRFGHRLCRYVVYIRIVFVCRHLRHLLSGQTLIQKIIAITSPRRAALHSSPAHSPRTPRGLPSAPCR